MIIRVSDRLAKRIKGTVLPAVPPSPNPFADWTARLFTVNRTQYVLVSNTATLYSTIFFGKGITGANQLINRMLDNVRDLMRFDGFESIYESRVAPENGEVSFSKAANRSVTGSMNEMIFRAKWHLRDDEMSPFDVSSQLNKTPMSYLKYEDPRKMFGRMAEESTGTAMGSNVISFPEAPGRPKNR